MKCSDLQFVVPLYGDPDLDEAASLAVSTHLDTCPLCRQRTADHREIVNGLRRLTPPTPPVALQDRVRRSVRLERRVKAPISISADVREWLTMCLMPYSVGVAASLLIGMSFLTMMFSARSAPEFSMASSGPVLLASNSNPFLEGDILITPAAYAQTRFGLGDESPSVNPQGALIALTKSFIRGGMKDDEVVVVADVFGNGLARIAEVVEPSRDREAVMQLQKALQTDPAFAPFVPNQIEKRPESVRVVLKFQSVDVHTDEPAVPNRPEL